ncbi:MAG: methyltransferase domain-containing protein [Armatimonadota bacterium]|nr:methyltransferase domain-containing protein [Armatimonadota bacterium]MDR7437980.1 methyltransferase domain-containing protein [Armatimonadota bacterium]MDR7473062.1 methyltransferase domain-containing protein [Armatimonadota bacterium]MDR7508095.1 methyltransferase domain-containing protein [Armatimonadota bacterium]MDR7509399.1 methyltransferase domain-containing protein [Armatimonadota bacterium]
MRADREKWEQRYQAGERVHDGRPSAILMRWAHLVRPGRALDAATGLGRNALFLASQGFEVDAVDISPTALAQAADRARRRGLRIRWIEADLDCYPLPRARYDLVVVSFFLKRRLVPALKAAVRPGGLLVMENHLVGPEPDEGPGPAHRLRPGDLWRWFRGWEILELAEGLFTESGRRMWVGRIAARRPSPATRGAPRVRQRPARMKATRALRASPVGPRTVCALCGS